jgi:hypothetical protein
LRNDSELRLLSLLSLFLRHCGVRMSENLVLRNPARS